MKRTPLRRKTPMARTPSNLKRSRLKPMSKKRRTLIDQVSEAREAYRMDFPECALCGQPATDVHEISRGPAREESLKHPETWIHVCRACHSEKFATMPIERQLALKCIQSPEYFDRRLVNVIRGRDADAVTESEVVLAAYRLGTERGA